MVTLFIYVITAHFVIFGPTFPKAYRLHRHIIMSCDLSQSYITKCRAAEDTSRDPNTNFINFTNFIIVTICFIQNGPRKSSPSSVCICINTEINTVAKYECKRKAGYFSVAHCVYFKRTCNLR